MPELNIIANAHIAKLYATWSQVSRAFDGIAENSRTKTHNLLPSLAGLNSLFHRRLQDQYCAGHWRSDPSFGPQGRYEPG